MDPKFLLHSLSVLSVGRSHIYAFLVLTPPCKTTEQSSSYNCARWLKRRNLFIWTLKLAEIASNELVAMMLARCWNLKCLKVFLAFANLLSMCAHVRTHAPTYLSVWTYMPACALTHFPHAEHLHACALMRAHWWEIHKSRIFFLHRTSMWFPDTRTPGRPDARTPGHPDTRTPGHSFGRSYITYLILYMSPEEKGQVVAV